MRETCARVVAAALLTGAIAIVVGMSVLVDTPREPTRSVAAPPSAVERSVLLTAQIQPQPKRTTARVVTTHTSYPAPRPAVVKHRLVVVHTHRPSTPRRRQLASVPAPAPIAPAPPPAAAPAPAQPPPPAAPTPVVPDTSPGPGRHGRGNAYGHENQDQNADD